MLSGLIFWGLMCFIILTAYLPIAFLRSSKNCAIWGLIGTVLLIISLIQFFYNFIKDYGDVPLIPYDILGWMIGAHATSILSSTIVRRYFGLEGDVTLIALSMFIWIYGIMHLLG